jgi:RHS repeat-associated protein
VGNTYECDNGSTVRKYYYAGGVRVAMRTGEQTYYLLSDHLGSTNVTANSSGAQISKLLYKPWGETRYSTGSTPTTWRFTGQREDATIGLYFYNARYLDPQLGRFTQADTIVPEPGNPQALNRYAYVLNNPVRYTDPTGMFEQSAIEEYLQSLDLDNWRTTLELWMQDEQWWTALLAAQAGDVLTALDDAGNMRFAKFQGEGRTKLTGMSLVDDVFGEDAGVEVRLDNVYGGSLGLPAAVVTFNHEGQMNAAYGLHGFRVDVSTVSQANADFHAFMFNVGLGAVYSFIPAASSAQWLLKLVGTAGAGVYVFPAVRCTLGLCSGDQWLTVSMSEFSRGSENVLPHYYWKYYSEIRYHEHAAVYRRASAR